LGSAWRGPRNVVLNVSSPLPDTSATRHFGTGADTSAQCRHQIEEKSGLGSLLTQDNSGETAPPVIRLKLGAEVSGHFGTNFVVPKCLVADVSGSLRLGLVAQRLDLVSVSASYVPFTSLIKLRKYPSLSAYGE